MFTSTTFPKSLVMFFLSFCLGLTLATVGTYKYTSNHYEAILAAENKAKAEAISKANIVVLEKERLHATIVQKLEAEVLEANRKEASVLAANRRLLNDYNRLLISASDNPAEADASATASSNPINNTSAIELPRAFSEFLIEAFYQCDQAASYATIGHEYAKEVEKQRQEILSNDK